MDTFNRASADRRLCEQAWKDPRFFPINIDTVMIYFCQRENPFFDQSSDNAMLMMQNRDISAAQLEEKLKQCTGIQYVLVQPPSSAPLFVIRKQQRNSAHEITPLCHYYVLDGTVYQAPDLYTFIHSRLVNAMDPLRNAFTAAIDMLRFSPHKGYSWDFKTKTSSSSNKTADGENRGDNDGEEGAQNALNVRATPYQRFRTDMLLKELTARFNLDEQMDGESSGNERAEAAATSSSSVSARLGQEQQLAATAAAPSNANLNFTAGGAPNPIDFGLVFGSSSNIQSNMEQP